MTRDAHIKWCKERAIQEYDFYSGEEKQRNGLTSMMSDLGKHPETASQGLQALCLDADADADDAPAVCQLHQRVQLMPTDPSPPARALRESCERLLTDGVLATAVQARDIAEDAFHKRQNGAVYDDARTAALRHTGWDAVREHVVVALAPFFQQTAQQIKTLTQDIGNWKAVAGCETPSELVDILASDVDKRDALRQDLGYVIARAEHAEADLARARRQVEGIRQWAEKAVALASVHRLVPHLQTAQRVLAELDRLAREG